MSPASASPASSRSASGELRHRQEQRSHLGRRPALDGLRGIAVLLVLLYHANHGILPGAYLSIDLFFVLSGYLICGVLLRQIARHGHIDWRGFYAARARRLLPALLVTLVAVLAASTLWLDGVARTRLRGDALATLAYVANWRFIASDESYFATAGSPSPLRHMWSLAVEEQFYLVFPLLLAALVAWLGSRRRVTWVLLALAGMSALVQAALAQEGVSTRVYYGTDTRAHELLIGAALATWFTPSRRHALSDSGKSGVLAAGGALGIIACIALADETSGWVPRGGTVALTVAACSVIAAVEAVPGGSAARALGWRPLAWVGEISYGLYLWHWPIFILLPDTRLGLDGVAGHAARIALTFALATASARFLELPVRRFRARSERARRRAALAWAAALVCAVAACFATPAPTLTPVVASDAPAGSVSVTDVGPNSASKRILVVGDSVGTTLAGYFPSERYPDVYVHGSTQMGCGTARQWLVVGGVRQAQGNPACDDLFAPWHPALTQTRPDVVVWSLGGWDVFDHWIDGKTLPASSPEYAAHLRSRMEEGLRALGSAPKIVMPKVACYASPPTPAEGQDLAEDRNDPARAAAVNRVIDQFAAAHPGRVTAPDPASWLCAGTDAARPGADTSIRFDGVHYTPTGVERFWIWLMPQIAGALGTTANEPTAK